MMYSRKFGGMDLPAGYGGVALREQRQQAEAQERQRGQEDVSEGEGRFQNRAHSSSGAPDFDRGEEQAKRSAFTGQEEEGRRPRYPLYESREEPSFDDRPPRRGGSGGQGGRSEEKTGGLLSSLFSLAGKSFTMEDIVLAGLILLLLNEKEGKDGVDSELLLILGLLLMSGKG